MRAYQTCAVPLGAFILGVAYDMWSEREARKIIWWAMNAGLVAHCEEHGES